jgi:hypothetical protein
LLICKFGTSAGVVEFILTLSEDVIFSLFVVIFVDWFIPAGFIIFPVVIMLVVSSLGNNVWLSSVSLKYTYVKLLLLALYYLIKAKSYSVELNI